MQDGPNEKYVPASDDVSDGAAEGEGAAAGEGVDGNRPEGWSVSATTDFSFRFDKVCLSLKGLLVDCIGRWNREMSMFEYPCSECGDAYHSIRSGFNCTSAAMTGMTMMTRPVRKFLIQVMLVTQVIMIALLRFEVSTGGL